MADIVLTSMKQFFTMIPICVLVVIIFDFIGSFFFGKR